MNNRIGRHSGTALAYHPRGRLRTCSRADWSTVQGMFDDLADVYEAMIDWPKRLAHEEPFYRRLFERLGARSVLDVACGTGRHAAMFHSWGLRVEGADLSPAMIDRARSQLRPAGRPAVGGAGVRRADRAGRTVRRRRVRRQLAGPGPGHGDGRAGDSADARRGPRRRRHRHSGVESVASARRPVCVAEMPARALPGPEKGTGSICAKRPAGSLRQMVPVPFSAPRRRA